MAEVMEPSSKSVLKRSYSWWWDSHISPKNSKWLQENLTDMDNKIKAMIKLIEEDADSFARRAEMYYKKRPELMKLVEEFYRAYRALAERYDHVTGELRQAHRTIAAMFPNQIQLMFLDEPPSESPHYGEEKKVSFVNVESPDGNHPLLSKEGLKHLNCMFDDEENKRMFECLLTKKLSLDKDEVKDYEHQKLQQEVSRLIEENRILKNQNTFESMRAKKAEAESQCLNEAISELKSEMEAAFLRYQVSRERELHLEAEISESREEIQHLNDEISIKVSKLNIAENRCIGLEKEKISLRLEMEKYNQAVSRQVEEVSDLLKQSLSLQNTVNSESLRADQAETESKRLREAISGLKSEMEAALLQYKVSQERISDLEAEISHTKYQFQNVRDEISMKSSKLNIAEEENKSLQLKADRFEKVVKKQEEVIKMREEELYKVKQFMEDECQQRINAEINKNISLQLEINKFKQRMAGQDEQIAISEKELEKLKQTLEDERRGRLIAEMAHQSLEKLYSQSEDKVRLLGLEIRSKAALEEELKRTHDENDDLNGKIFSSVLKIARMQDDIISLMGSKHKTEEELRFHVREKKAVQQELYSFKKEKNDLEERQDKIMEHIEEVNLNMLSLQTLIKELLDAKKELKHVCKKQEEEKALQLEKNSALENSLSNVTAELKWLQEKIKGLEGYCESLHGTALMHISENTVLVSHVEEFTQSIQKLSEKNNFFENSLSDINVEFQGLRGKVKDLEDSCQTLYYQKCCLIAENSNLVVQVEEIRLHLQSLENRFSTLEGKFANMEKAKNLALHQVEELQDLLRSEKEVHENRFLSISCHISDLNNQINLLKEENQLIIGELEEKQYETLKSDIDSLILQRVLYEINEKNMILTYEYKRIIQKWSAENSIVELKLDQYTQENKLAPQLEHNEKLMDWIHVMVKAFEGKKNSENSQAGHKDMVQLISHKIIERQASVSNAKEEIHQFSLEKSVFATLLEQLGLSLAELRTQNRVLKQESEMRNQEISVLQSKNHELIKVNEQLKKDLNAFSQQKEELKTLPLFGTPEISAVNESLSEKFYELKKQNEALEVKNQAIVEKSENHEHQSCIFRSPNAENSSDIDQLIRDVNYLQGATGYLGLNIRAINENMRALEAENIHLRDFFANLECKNLVHLLEDDVHKARNFIGEIDYQTGAGKSPLEQGDMEWPDTNYKLQLTESRDKEFFTSLEDPMVQINKGSTTREELENKYITLSKENTQKDDEIKFLHQSNDNFIVELFKCQKDVEVLRSKEKYLTSELQRSKEESSSCEELDGILLSLHVASINELIFKEKVFELMLKLKSLEFGNILQSKMQTKEVALRNLRCREEIEEKFDALEEQNTLLKAELTDYLPLVESLNNDIASLEEHTLSLANYHIPTRNSMKGRESAHNNSHIQGKDWKPNKSAGILELKKLHAKVKVLKNAVIDTERLLEQQEIVSNTNIESESRKKISRRSKRDNGQLESEEKENISISRKNDAAQNEAKLLKDDQMMKDIELDHIVSSSRREQDFKNETDEQAPVNAVAHYQIEIMEEERNENPSSELVMGEELSIDKLKQPLNATEFHEEWGKRISETLSSDAQRLLILLKSLEESKKSLSLSEPYSQSSTSEFNAITGQLKAVDGAITQLIEINIKLSKMAENLFASSESNKSRKRISVRVERSSERIGRVELELQRIQNILSNLMEEAAAAEGKTVKVLERRSRIPLKHLIYGKKSELKQEKRQFCACMRLKTKDN